jgi:hypothetical protein
MLQTSFDAPAWAAAAAMSEAAMRVKRMVVCFVVLAFVFVCLCVYWW